MISLRFGGVIGRIKGGQKPLDVAEEGRLVSRHESDCSCIGDQPSE